MVKKRGAIKKISKQIKFPIWILVAILAIGGILLYNSLKAPAEEAPEEPFDWNVSEEVDGSKTPIEKVKDIIKRIVGGGGGGGAGAGAGGGAGAGTGDEGEAGDGETPVEYTTDLTICTNAQDSGLCNGLDIAYGDGYEAACCSERGLCC